MASQQWTVGSAAECDVRVQATTVSRKHLILRKISNGYTVEDLGSSNGTYVNGSRINAGTVTPVSEADVVTLGAVTVFPWDALKTPALSASSRIAPLEIKFSENDSVLMIGRGQDCDIRLDYPMVSSRHARLSMQGGIASISDLNTPNGTYVNGVRIDQPVVVKAGDIISLGSFSFELSQDGYSFVQKDRRQDVAIEACGISVEVLGKKLLADVSLVIRSGELVGLMGPSGSGKSTLMHCLNGYAMPVEGKVSINGVDLYQHPDEFRGQIGYVPQDDIMHADLTVEQALWYSARLRLPRDHSNAEIRQRITTVIDQLGLKGTEQTRIGSADRRGISGGQRKRVNVAMELITDPPLLLLDEPTSGLSSTDALSLMRLLRKLADTGKTIILTIHQPSLDAFKLMDGIVVVAKDHSSGNTGRLVWFGPAYPDAGAFFEPTNKSPDADAVMRGLDRQRVVDWQATYRKSEAYEKWGKRPKSTGRSVSQPQRRKRTSLFDGLAQLAVLVQQMFAIKIADAWSTGVLLVQAPVIALLVAGVFGSKATTTLAGTSENPSDWIAVSGAVATTSFLLALAAIWFGCSNAAREIVSERAIYKRERMVGLSLYAYLASKVIVLGVLCLIQCSMLLLIVGAGCRLEGNFSSLFGLLFLAASVGVAIGLCVSALVRTAEAAAGILPLVILPMVILGGILLPLNELPSAATYLADGMPSRWAFEGLLIDESKARPLLERPDPNDLGNLIKEDLAEKWFPVDGWRSDKNTPWRMLAAMWILGLLAVRSIVICKEK